MMPPGIEYWQAWAPADGVFFKFMETEMSRFFNSWCRIGALAGLALLAACAMQNRQTTNVPPPATAHASVYQVAFEPGSYAINPAGQRAIEDVSSVVDGNPHALVTIVGRTDATGSVAYNMQLSKKRAAAVRDGLLALAKIDQTHVDTAWTGQERQDVGTYNGIAEARNRVVDIYIH
jgi:outer membrane protein OmpA-like peptidoglycan-associated protein